MFFQLLKVSDEFRCLQRLLEVFTHFTGTGYSSSVVESVEAPAEGAVSNKGTLLGTVVLQNQCSKVPVMLMQRDNFTVAVGDRKF